MADLVPIDRAQLPAEAHYRPLGRGAWYGRRIPSALAVGAGVGLCSALVHPLSLGVALVAILGWSVVRRRRMVTVLQRNDDALAQLVAGDLDEAGRAFDVLCQEAKAAPGLHSLMVYNRAAVFLENGQPERAAALLLAVLDAGWVGPRGALTAYFPAAMGRLAMAQALRGQLEEAQTWRTRAHAATSAPKRGMHLLVDLLVEAKLGRYDRVVNTAEDSWARAENMLTARQLRVAHVLEAFALEGLAVDEYRGVSRQTDLARAVEAARPTTASRADRSEFRFLTEHWPELAAFAERHRL